MKRIQYLTEELSLLEPETRLELNVIGLIKLFPQYFNERLTRTDEKYLAVVEAL